jgi:hypothetical protein
MRVPLLPPSSITTITINTTITITTTSTTSTTTRVSSTLGQLQQ